LACIFTAQAQAPSNLEIKAHPQIPLYRDTPTGQVIDAMITFTSAGSAGPGRPEMRMHDFDMRTFKNGDTNLVQLHALAPECLMNLNTKISSDSGPIQIFTPTTNVYVQGRGFYSDQSQHFLILSNDVETRIVKSLLKAPMFGGANSNNNSGQTVRVLADYCRFDSLSNIIDYIGHVRVFDPQGDSQSRAMTVYLTTNNAIRSITEHDDVAIDLTNRGAATAESAFYIVTNGAERVRLTGHAVWRNGAEEAKAGEFDYDSLARTLHAKNDVRVHWPNPPGSLTNFAELSSDIAMLKWPPTNGPIEKMTADGRVLLYNHSDQSHATGDHALYDRTNDLFQLTGQPQWWNDQTHVQGDVLSMGLTNKIYRARGSAELTTREAASTNRTLHIRCDHLEYQTNLAEFHDRVVAQNFQNGALQETLSSRLLTTIMVSNKIQSAIAQGDVHGETVPDASGVTKTLACETLTAWRSIITGLTEKIVGQTNAVIKEFGGAVKPVDATLNADTVTVLFSPATNRVDQSIADGRVIIDERKGAQPIHATADHAVYLAGTNGQVTLTGQPFAENGKYFVTNAASLVWQPQSNRFAAFGFFQIIPLSTNN